MMNRVILAGMFSCSNMGQKVNPAHVKWALKNPPKDEAANVIHIVDSFCGAFMETNEHERIFYAEGKMWFKELSKMKDERIKELHPDLVKLYEDTEKEIANAK